MALRSFVRKKKDYTKLKIFMIADRVDVKPLSVNRAWQGRRFKTQDYKDYETNVQLLLSKQTMVFNKAPLQLYLRFGISNMANDIDNGVKPFIDILQKKYGFNDKYICRLIVEKQLVEKGTEFIEFQLMEIDPHYIYHPESLGFEKPK